jgi:LysM repeat protein
LFVFVSLLLAIYTCVDRSLASERSTVWGSKPVLEHFVMNPELARELRESIALTGEEIESIVELAQLEADMVQALERESLDVIGNPGLDLAQKRKQVAEIGYNQRLLQIVNENQVSLKQQLSSGKYEMLVDWVENRWRVESRQSSSFEITAPMNYSYAAPGAASYPRSFEVYATRYDAGDRYIIALPDKCLKFANGGALQCNSGYQYGQNYSVAISYKGKTVYATVGESGPWNIDDNYWSTVYDPQPRRLFGDLPLGVPEAQAAYFNGYNNGGVDQFGRVVTSPVAIDISYAVAADLGLPSGNNKVTVSFLWTEGWDEDQAGNNSTPGPTPLPVVPVVTSTPNPDGSIIHIVQQGQTLSGIATIYDIAIQDMLALNNLTLDAILLPGDKIVIKPAEPTPVIMPTLTSTFITPKAAKTPIPSITSSQPLDEIPQTPPQESQQAAPYPAEGASDQIALSRNDIVLFAIGGLALIGVLLVLLGSWTKRSS